MLTKLFEQKEAGKARKVFGYQYKSPLSNSIYKELEEEGFKLERNYSSNAFDKEEYPYVLERCLGLSDRSYKVYVHVASNILVIYEDVSWLDQGYGAEPGFKHKLEFNSQEEFIEHYSTLYKYVKEIDMFEEED